MKEFNSVQDFIKYFNLGKGCTKSIDGSAYFEFTPYSKDNVIIRGWIVEVSNTQICVSFKYREFSLGYTSWSIEQANKYITHINYWYDED